MKRRAALAVIGAALSPVAARLSSAAIALRSSETPLFAAESWTATADNLLSPAAAVPPAPAIALAPGEDAC